MGLVICVFLRFLARGLVCCNILGLVLLTGLAVCGVWWFW